MNWQWASQSEGLCLTEPLLLGAFNSLHPEPWQVALKSSQKCHLSHPYHGWVIYLNASTASSQRGWKSKGNLRAWAAPDPRRLQWEFLRDTNTVDAAEGTSEAKGVLLQQHRAGEGQTDICSFIHPSLQTWATVKNGTKGQLCQELLVQFCPLNLVYIFNYLIIGLFIYFLVGIQAALCCWWLCECWSQQKGESRGREGRVLLGAAQVRLLCAGASSACSRIAPEKAFFSLVLWLWSPFVPFSYSAQNPKGAELTMKKC